MKPTMNRTRTTKRVMALAALASLMCMGFSGGRTALLPGPAPPSMPIGDRKALHGAHCKPMDQDSSGLDYVYDAYGIRNDSGLPTQYICPLLRDVLGGTSDLNHAIVELAIHDEAECTLFSMNEDNNGSVILDSVQVSASDGGNRIVQFEYFGLETSGGNEGAYWLECELRFFDIINHIYTNEG